MTALRSDFESALRFLARVTEVSAGLGYEMPVLVGGAAIELFANGLIATGDFDIVTASQQRLEAELGILDFVKPSG